MWTRSFAAAKQLIKTALKVCVKVSLENTQLCFENAIKKIGNLPNEHQSILFEIAGSGLTSIFENQEVTFIEKAWSNKNEYRDNEPVQVRKIEYVTSRV